MEKVEGRLAPFLKQIADRTALRHCLVKRYEMRVYARKILIYQCQLFPN